MNALRSDRVAAILLLAAGVVGVAIANSPLADAAFAIRDIHVGPAALRLDISLEHWVSDGLLALFFLIAATELRHELQHGELDSRRTAIVPLVAALAGVVVPALVFLAMVSDPELRAGWPIPTATDIAFALGILAIAGRALPGRVRATLLALAVIDDLIAIVLIAVLFTSDLQLVPLLVAVPVVALFWLVCRRAAAAPSRWLVVALVVLGLVAWGLVHASGVHATVAGVALGLVIPPTLGDRVREALTPWTNGVVLPLFALTASLVALPVAGGSGDDALGPMFWAIVVALPVGKLLGIGLGAAIAGWVAARGRGAAARLPLGDIAVVATLGGVGFTVSLLMNELAFADSVDIRAQGTLGVLAGSIVAIVVGTVVTAVRARRYR